MHSKVHYRLTELWAFPRECFIILIMSVSLKDEKSELTNSPHNSDLNKHKIYSVHFNSQLHALTIAKTFYSRNHTKQRTGSEIRLKPKQTISLTSEQIMNRNVSKKLQMTYLVINYLVLLWSLENCGSFQSSHVTFHWTNWFWHENDEK